MLYAEIVEKFDTGDLVLFKDNTFLSSFIGLFTTPGYCHGGIIIKNPVIDSRMKKGLFMLHTTAFNKKMTKFKVELKNFKDVYEECYYQNMYWRKLHTIRDVDFYNRLFQAYSMISDNKHTSISIDWIQVLYKNSIKKHDIDYAWAVLCAYVYTSLGLLPLHTNWTCATPDMFETHTPKELHFSRSILEDEILIK